MLSGGGQERGLRSGTLATPLVVGMGEACEVANQEMNYDSERIKKLSERLLTGIQTQLEGVYRNGGNIESSIYPGCVNLSFEGVKGDELMVALKEIALSAGSACSSSSSAPSYVLMALGVPEHLAKSSLRFGIGRFTSEQEIDFVIDRVVKHVRRLRSRVSSASAEFADHKQLMQSSA